MLKWMQVTFAQPRLSEGHRHPDVHSAFRMQYQTFSRILPRGKGTLRDYGTGFHLKVKAVQVVQLFSAYTKITDGLRLGTDFDSLIQAVGQHQKTWSFLARERSATELLFVAVAETRLASEVLDAER